MNQGKKLRIDNQLKLSLIQRVSIFSNIDENVLKQLIPDVDFFRFRKGRFVFCQGDVMTAYVVIVEGRLKVIKETGYGKGITIGFFGPGETIGNVYLFDNEPLNISFQAAEPTIVMTIAREKILPLFTREPALVLNILQKITRRVKYLTETIADMADYNMDQRVFKTIRKLYSDRGPVIYITHQDIADMAGTTRETTSRIMGRLRREGVISYSRGKLAILDETRLSNSIIER